jgi:hypothetical protein
MQHLAIANQESHIHVKYDRLKKNYFFLKKDYFILKKDYFNLTKKDCFNLSGGQEVKIRTQSDYLFLSDWKEIPNTGQQNCGIFINKNNTDRLLKCGSDTDFVKINKINDTAGFKLFPYIHNVYKYIDGKGIDKTYIEMDRFNGDVTDLLTRKIPIDIIDSMVLNNGIKDHLVKLFYYKIHSTKGLNISFFDFDPTNIYIIKNKLPVPKNQEEYDKIRKSSIPFDIFIQKNEIYNNFVNEFRNSPLTHAIYADFINRYIQSLQQILPTINEQIFMLRYKLYQQNYQYRDQKFDNYAYSLEDNDIEYMGIGWKQRNRYQSKYFYIHILDWDSGLFPIENERDIEMCRKMVLEWDSDIFKNIKKREVDECMNKIKDYDKKKEEKKKAPKIVDPVFDDFGLGLDDFDSDDFNIDALIQIENCEAFISNWTPGGLRYKEYEEQVEKCRKKISDWDRGLFDNIESFNRCEKEILNEYNRGIHNYMSVYGQYQFNNFNISIIDRKYYDLFSGIVPSDILEIMNTNIIFPDVQEKLQYKTLEDARDHIYQNK